MFKSNKSKLSLHYKSDLFGSAASTLCMVHCIATPFIFKANTVHVSCGSTGPVWWHSLDFIFLMIGIIAIRKTQQSSSSQWIPNIMYINWTLLALFIFNEKLSIIPLPAMILYLLAGSLATLHIYNINYYSCHDTKCYIHHT